MLKSVTLSDFRSIRGTITVPLDAPIVLVHGQNGAGKTSLLSGIELALTRAVPSLQRVDPEYIQHLVHKEATESSVHLVATGLGSESESEIRVTPKGVEGKALLTQDYARFYSERCYLAQSSLGRLLELYQDKDTRKSDSPLTRFVRDPLGLDHLDAVIDGLHDAGDVCRFRSTVPLYGDTKENISVVSRQIDRLRAELFALDKEISSLTTQNVERHASLSLIPPGLGAAAGEPEENDERELQRLTAIRRETGVMSSQWSEISVGQSALDRATVERRSAAAEQAQQQWHTTTGVQLEQLLARLSAVFPDLPPISSGGPVPAHAAATSALSAELERCGSVLERDASDREREAQLAQDIARAKSRSQVLAG